VLQQVGAGAQQFGATATGAQQVGAAIGAWHATGAAQVGAQLGAQAAGAAQDGAGEQQTGAGAAQPCPPWPNRPALALFMLTKQTNAAVIHANFILNSSSTIVTKGT